VGCEDLSVVGGCQAAQAVEFIRALRVQLLEMTSQLTWIERQDVTGRNARACAMRIEAAALSRDIAEAPAALLAGTGRRRHPRTDRFDEIGSGRLAGV
jgi:hypothetical protein